MAGKWADQGVRLAALVEGKFDSRADFARRLGVSEDVVSNWIRGVTRLRGFAREEVAKCLGLEAADLREHLLGNAERSWPNNMTRSIDVVRSGLRPVPVYGSVPAGQPGLNVSDAIEFVELPDWGGNFVRWGRVITGTSMEDEFLEGDVAIFEDRRPESGNGVHAFKEGEDTFKIYRTTREGAELWPINLEEHEPMSAEGWDVKGVCIRRIRHGERGIRDIREYPYGLLWKFGSKV